MNSSSVVVDVIQERLGPWGGGRSGTVTATTDDLYVLRDTLKKIYRDLGTEWTEKAVSTTLNCVSPNDDMFEAIFQNGTTIYFRSARFRSLYPYWTIEKHEERNSKDGGMEDLTIQYKLNDIVSDLWKLHDEAQ